MVLAITFPDDDSLKYDNILARMLAALPSNFDKTEGSPDYNFMSTAAVEIALAGTWAQQVLERGFAQSTFGEYLRLRAEEHGVIKRLAVAATGIVTFTGTAGAVIPSGTIVSTASTETVAAVTFSTEENATIPVGGTVDVAIKAVQAGTGGNVAAGTIQFLAAPITGVTGVINNAETSGGLNDETDTALLERYLTRVRSPGTSGNKADYINWALEIPGVGGAQVISLWNGPGTVKVVIIDLDKQPAGTELIDTVQEIIAPDYSGSGKAPIGADVTVAAAESVLVNVNATLVLSGGFTLSQVKAAFEEELTSYLKSIAFSNDPSPKYVRIGSILLDTIGVQDYSDLEVNGGTGNVNVTVGKVAIKGMVTFIE